MSSDDRASISRGIRRLLRNLRDIRIGRNQHQDQNRKKTTEPVAPPPMPFLPARRLRFLTPTPSRESLFMRTECSASPGAGITTSLSGANSAFFTSLPPEIRRRVLVMAFGGRTLHMDLRLAHPALQTCPTATAAAGQSQEHGGGTAPRSCHRAADWVAPQAWRWWGCVCHCVLPPGSQWDRRARARAAPGRPLLYRHPEDDGCIRGEATFCDLWSSWEDSRPSRSGRCCAVGVMGWLLACRRAYAEGIDVLYSTNTFFIESHAIFDHVFRPAPESRQLLLPERLASIGSLELKWAITLFGRFPIYSRQVEDDGQGSRHADRAQLATHLSHLSAPFPNLRRLVLSFSDHLYNDPSVRPGHALAEIDLVLLRPIAEAVARLPQRQRLRQPVVVELPSVVFNDLQTSDAAEALGLDRDRSMSGHQGVWLRYPIRKGHQDEDCGGGFFYYIKRGVQSDLFWDYKDNVRRFSQLPAHATGIL